VLLHFCRCRLLRLPRRSDAILQGLRACDFPPKPRAALKEGWITIAMIVVADWLGFRIFCRLLMKKLIPSLMRRGIRSLVNRALALRPRGGLVNDRLVLHKLSGQLQLEWHARAVHPWDRDLPPCSQVEAYFEQAVADTDLAIGRIFQRLPEIDVIEIRVLDTQDPTKIMLAGVVTREDALGTDLSHSPKMRLKMMGIQYAKIMGTCLEFVPASPASIFLLPVATGTR
jgi:hypothetical protein